MAIAAPSGAGKSTLRDALERLGAAPFADDAVIVRAGAEGHRSPFLPFLAKRGPDLAGARLERPPGGVAEPPLRAVVLLRPGPGPPSLRRLRGAAAFEPLLENAYCLPPFDAPANRVVVEKALALAAAVPVYELCFEATGRAEPATVGALLSLLRGAGLDHPGARSATPPEDSAARGAPRSSPASLARHGVRAIAGLWRHPASLLAAVPIAARYLLARALRHRLGPGRQARLLLRRAGWRTRSPMLGIEARMRAAAAIFEPGAAGGCLERSLAVARSLADGGLGAEVVVGWSERLAHGHAWVDVEGLPIVDDRHPDAEFVELWRFGSDGSALGAASQAGEAAEAQGGGGRRDFAARSASRARATASSRRGAATSR